MKKIFYPIAVLIFSLGIFAAPHFASAARVYAVSAEQTISVGQTIVVEWYLDTEGVPVNVVNGSILFSSGTLSLANITAADSAVSLWVTQPALTAPGVVSFSGGIPAGIEGSAIPLLRTTFLSIKTGTAALALGTESEVLENDGHATPETLTFVPVQFSILPSGTLPVQVTSSTDPDQTKWYKSPDVAIRFTPKEGDAYSYSFSSNPEMIPGDAAIQTDGTANFKNLPDGIYTFKLNSKTGSGSWQEAGIYRVQIDTTPPEAFTPVVSSDPTIFGGKKFVSFSTTDKASGLAYYSERSGWFGIYTNVSTPYEFRRPFLGSVMRIKATDYAGNSRVEKIKVTPYVPTFLFVILLAAIIIGGSILLRRRSYLKHEKKS